MPALVGPVQVGSITGGSMQFGDAFFYSPKSAGKSFSGSGSQNTGVFVITNSGLNATNVLDTNLADMPIVGNN
ncbi:MAG: spore germination protein [Bacillus sp. (in: firmicutes)]